MQPIHDDEQEQETLEETPSLEQWRELGSAEASAWTITISGQQPMSLTEAHEYKLAQEAKRQEHLRIYAEEEESEARIRAAKAQEDKD